MGTFTKRYNPLKHERWMQALPWLMAFVGACLIVYGLWDFVMWYKQHCMTYSII